MTPNDQPATEPSVSEPPALPKGSSHERHSVSDRAAAGYRIATFTVFLITIVVFLVYGLSRITHVLELFTIGLLIAMAIDPAVVWLEKRRIRRMVSIGALLAVLVGGLGAGTASLAPVLIDQSTNFIREIPTFGERLQKKMTWLDKRFPGLHVTEKADQLQAEAYQSLNALQGTATIVFTTSVTTIFESVIVVFIVVFLLTDPHPLVRGLRGLMPPHWQPEVSRIGELAVGKVQAWIQGTLILMLSIAVMDTIGLMYLGVPFALLWGVFSGLMEVIPTLGPIVAAVPPIIVGLTMQNPMTALWVAVLYTGIQQIESNVLVPLIMSNKVRLHPVTLLFFLLMMAEFLGIFGALIATPLAAVLKVLYMELYYRRLHGSLPPEEANDPIRLKRKRRLSRKRPDDTIAQSG